MAAFNQIPWGPGSPTGYASLDAALRSYASLEAAEAERLGAPRGPRAEMHLLRPGGSGA